MRSFENAPLQVLHVDDDLNDLALFNIAVEEARLSMRVHLVESGSQALEYLEGQGRYADRNTWPLPELLVLDLMMPGMDGFELLAWRKLTPAASVIPVVIFSSIRTRREHRRALALGADKIMPKPFHFQGWKTAVQEIWEFALERLQSPLEPVVNCPPPAAAAPESCLGAPGSAANPAA